MISEFPERKALTMSSVPKTSYLLADDHFYEPLDRYQPVLEDYHDLVRAMVPEGWIMVRQGVWFHAVPTDKDMPPQGFKIHVSATYRSAPQVLEQIVPILIADRTAFKFGLDRRILAIMTGKNWHRGSSGKFITIYPYSETHFVDLIERLHQATAGLEGPYILSDRRYKESRILYYRYGGLAPLKEMTAKGEARYTMKTPEGSIVEDERQPFFVLPPWVQDPFEPPPEADDDTEPGTLKNGRYLVTKALTFSNSGGVYLATDKQNGETVVIKEARPFVNITPSGDDAVALLEKEYRLLKKIEKAGIAPVPYDFFKDWEHSYLVEEYLGDVPSLRFYAGGRGAEKLILSTQPNRQQVEAFWAEYKKIFVEVAELVEKLHAHGIVFMDLSMNNILVVGEDDQLALKFIDFEGAFEPAIEAPTFIFTPGFIAASDLRSQTYDFSSDYYGFGALMMSYLIPITGMMGYDNQAHLRFLRAVCADFGLPVELVGLIEGLMTSEAGQRRKPTEVTALLADLEICSSPRFVTPVNLDEQCEEVIRGILEHLEQVRTPERTDRLFPADPKMYTTNPLSLGYGAVGVAYTLQRISGTVPQPVLDWILQHEPSAASYPPGLFVGLAGVAWGLEEIGLRDRALEVLALAENHPELESSPDVFYGIAGTGLAQLRFHLATGAEHHLERAVAIGDGLLSLASEDENGNLSWPDTGEGTPIGFGHGASGISLFLLYLHLASNEERFLRAGQQALDFDLLLAEKNTEDALTWRIRDLPSSTMLPYFRYGSAGIGMAAVRYFWVTGEARYREALEGMYPDLDRKYAIFPGLFVGLAGIGELLIDLGRTQGFEERARLSLEKLISGLLLFRVDSPYGLTFPGYELFRLSSDVGTGAAGIALFLHRYLQPRHQDFLLDELIERRQGLQAASAAAKVAASPIDERSEVLA